MTKKYKMLLTENMNCTLCGAELNYTETIRTKYNITTGKKEEFISARYWVCPNKGRGIMQYLDKHLKFNDMGGQATYYWQL